MTENEAIRDLEYLIEECSAYPPETGVNETIGSLQYCITALREIQRYREIGTVEECREAVEKQKAKKPKLKYKPRFLGKTMYTCPNCGNCCLEEFANERQRNNYCWDCGQKLDWNKNLEGMEDDSDKHIL